MEAEAEAEIFYEDYDTRAEVINQCHSALTAVEYVDPYDKKGQEQKNRIKSKALEVLDYYISEIHAEIFDVNYEEED